MDHGVMGADYAAGRLRARHLVYRYKVRAQVAVDALREAGDSASSPSVLDLGAAEGLTLLQMRELLGGGGRYVGVELSDALLGEAPALPANVELVKGDVMNL